MEYSQEDILKELQRRNSSLGLQPSKPMIGNEQTGQFAGRVVNGLSTLFGGKPVASDSALDTMIKYNQLQTGTPEFKLKEAQTRADIDMEKALQIESAKRNLEAKQYQDALEQENGGTVQSQVPLNTTPYQVSAQPSITSPQALPGQQNVPKFIQVSSPGTRKYDASIGRFIDEPGKVSMEKNPDYLTPEELQAKSEKEQMLRDTANQNLGSIQEAKKGVKYFGPLGNLPTIVAPSSLPIPGVGNQYPERKMWETNVNQLLSQKVVDLITQMKQASKTGATGFGQLSDKEGAILREASTALKKDLMPEQAMYYLNEMEKIQKKFLGINTPEVGSEQYDPEKEARYQAWKASQNVNS